MLKKIVIAGIVIMAFVATSYAQVAIGVKVPFRMQTSSIDDISMSETWFGAQGTFEYDFLPILGVEFGVGYYMSLGGKTEYGDAFPDFEYKNTYIPISLFMKFYFPVGEGSAIHPYLAGGPTLSVNLITNKTKVNDDYEETGKTTEINFGAPAFMIGFDYDIAAAIKLGGALDFAFASETFSPEDGDDLTLSALIFGAALTFKYCF